MKIVFYLIVLPAANAVLRQGISGLPEVEMTVSGIDSGLISYSKGLLPIGSNF